MNLQRLAKNNIKRVEEFIVKKNIAIVLLSVVALVCFGGWVHSAQEARSNAIVMHSEAKIIRSLKGIK